MKKKYLWDNDSLKKATKCTLYGSCYGNKIEFDSRSINKDDIFLALKGNKTDGHLYVNEVIANGAGCAIVDHIPSNLKTLDRIVKVEDISKAIRDLASFNRKRSKAKIIGITGSVGKTSTKEIVRNMLQQSGKVFCTYGNLNGQIAIPVAVSSMPQDDDYAVYEMGMSYAGEMAKIAELVKPDIVIITNILGVHLEHFKSIKDIAKAKAEIFNGMSSDGVVLLNGDNEYTPFVMELAKQHNISKIYTFGVSKESDGCLKDYHVKDGYSFIDADICGENVKLKMEICGHHQALNVVISLLLAKILRLDLKNIANSFKSIKRLKGRGEISNLVIDNKKIVLVDESYNASPTSMRASLQGFSEFCDNSPFIKRRVAILGEMYELGPDAKELHKGLLESIKLNKIDKVITVGSLMQELAAVLPEEMKLRHFSDYKEAISGLNALLNNGDGLLVKGSNGTKLHEVVKNLGEIDAV